MNLPAGARYDPNAPFNQSKDDKARMFVCPTCESEVTEEDLEYSHLDTKNWKYYYLCPVCGDIFSCNF